MHKLILFTISISLFSICFASNDTNITKYRKLSYADFISEFPNNDTSSAIIDIFFDKKDNHAKGEMSILPINAIVFLISPVIGAGLSVVSVPLFIHGAYTMIKFRKKRLYKTLKSYHENGNLPKHIRKKAAKSLDSERYNYE